MATSPRPPACKPRPEDFPAAWSHRQARKAWVRSHGRNAFWPFAIAFFFGILTRSAVGFVAIMLFAVVAVAYARLRP